MLPPEGALGGVAGVSSGVDDDEGASDACPLPEGFEGSALLESFDAITRLLGWNATGTRLVDLETARRKREE